MITIKLKEFAEKKGKSITEIANETGLNRNTVTSLYHGRVDGIKFDTLEKIIKTYKLDIADILSKGKAKKTKKMDKRYKQEAAMTPFYVWPAVLAFNDLPKEYFWCSYKNGSIYFKDDYVFGYWDFWAMKDIASFVYKNRMDKKKFDELYELYLGRAKSLENMYFSVSAETIFNMNKKELKLFFVDLQKIYKKFFQYSLFIDSFDIGFDFEKIAEISQKYGLSKEEAETLTTPTELTFNNERELELLKIVKQLKKRRKTKPADVKNFVKEDLSIKEYKTNFDYYKSNYANVEHISDKEVEKEILRYLGNPKDLEKRLKELERMPKEQLQKIDRILKKHNLGENPLYFFNRLTFWREHRKMINLMGFHVLERVLLAIEKETGISLDSLRYLTFEEVGISLSGLISEKELKNRKEKGFFVDITERGMKMVEGKEALSLKDEKERNLREDEGQEGVVFGRTASQGYAKGTARIIFDQKDFHKMKQGDILVTGMTRPEFVPLMKMAGGIVTNEGGVTCHAAIVSRELGKPCIIGTKFATDMIKEGETIEVRANHGTVRIVG